MKRALLIALLFPVLAAAQPAPAKLKGFRGEFMANLNEVQDKIMELAESVPQSKYGWRPGPGVRSISEVYMHIAASNYFLSTFVGRATPKGLAQDMEKITDKKKVIEELKKSFEHLRTTITAEKDADLEKKVNMFGSNTTHRAVFVQILNHLHEHLGQSIAYARMNDVVPPWSR